MGEVCHRCGGDLPAASGESPFCPHCGAPQLYLALDYQSPETGGDPAPGDETTGTRPPPRPRQVEWKTAMRCAMAVAGVAGVLSLAAARLPLLSPLSSLWVMSGSLITLGLYERRRPLAWMDAGIGARIGIVVGLFLSAGLAVSLAVAGLIARFGLHAMAGFDADRAADLQKVIQQSASPIPPEALQWMVSPEFRAGYLLAGCAVAALLVLGLSTLGGAFAGMLRMRRRAI
jgi:hypothetical protein